MTMKRKKQSDPFGGQNIVLSVHNERPWAATREDLEGAGIPCKRCASIYVGHYGVIIPKRFERRAYRALGW